MRSLTFWDPRSIFAAFDDDFFADPYFPPSPPFGARYQADAIRHLSPRYEVTESDREFRLSVDVPGVKQDDMTIELVNDGRVLRVSGGRRSTTDASHEGYNFDGRFALGKNLVTSKITAHLSDGVLVLTAPKMEEVPPARQVIPIIRGEPPALMGVITDPTKHSKL
jgi:HSP20 family protein